MSKIKYDGNWLQIRTKDYVDKKGHSHQWEFVSRKDSDCSVTVVPIIRGVNRPDKIVLIKQFRPALSKYILGLPAGRVLPGESVEAASLRELKEETGYGGRLLSPPMPFYALPESSSEKTFIVMVEVQDHTEADKDPVTAVPTRKNSEPQNGVKEDSPGKGNPEGVTHPRVNEDLAGTAEMIDLAIMNVFELREKLLQTNEFSFDMRVLSVFFYTVKL